jgi:hypothetical protein
MRNPKLEELRKSLLTPPVPSAPPPYATPRRAGEIFSPLPGRSKHPAAVASEDAAVSLDERLDARSSPPPAPKTEESRFVEPTPTKVDEPAAGVTPRSLDRLARAVAALFEPTRECQARLKEITEASESIRQLSRLALQLCEPLSSFHDHIQKLSSSFESMRTFRDELSVLAESFAPVRTLRAQMIQLTETVRTHLAEVADGLKPAKALQIDIADLARAIDSVSELQSQFYALSKGFGDATDSKVADTRETENSLA